MKPKLTFVSLFIIISIILTIIVGFFIFKIIQGNKEALSETLPSNKTYPQSDSLILYKLNTSDVAVKEVLRSKVRSPFSILTINDSFQLVIYKIADVDTFSLTNVIFTNISVDQTSGYSYRVIDAGKYFANYIAGEPNSLITLGVTLSGNSIQKLQHSDSVLYYYLRCNNFSVRLSQKSPIDIFIEKKNKVVPMNIMFLKRKQKLYLLILTTQTKGRDISPNKLLQYLNSVID